MLCNKGNNDYFKALPIIYVIRKPDMENTTDNAHRIRWEEEEVQPSKQNWEIWTHYGRYVFMISNTVPSTNRTKAIRCLNPFPYGPSEQSIPVRGGGCWGGRGELAKLIEFYFLCWVDQLNSGRVGRVEWRVGGGRGCADNISMYWILELSLAIFSYFVIFHAWCWSGWGEHCFMKKGISYSTNLY